MEERFQKLFVPKQQLSLDETLIRAFGRIKFKVRIISKSARYGIKVYVLTDAQTAFALKVIVYTGSTTYNESAMLEEKKKTVDIVERLCEPYFGTFRTVYVDRFYTSVDLLRALRANNLFVTGTMMANRVPKHVHVNAADVRKMNRGETKKYVVNMSNGSGGHWKAGLVVWKDRKPVYCLSNDSNNFLMDVCHRRSSNGLIQVPRPVSIANYNTFMGGVDVADQRRLQANSGIMGLNRWWLKLFFYLLDVGTANALILYNESGKIRIGDDFKPKNIVEFKLALVEVLGRTCLEQQAEVEIHRHEIGKNANGGRLRCPYCVMRGRATRPTTCCVQCGIPMCSAGNGKAEEDCFTIIHQSTEMLQIVRQKYEDMQKKTSHKNKKTSRKKKKRKSPP